MPELGNDLRIHSKILYCKNMRAWLDKTTYNSVDCRDNKIQNEKKKQFSSIIRERKLTDRQIRTGAFAQKTSAFCASFCHSKKMLKTT